MYPLVGQWPWSHYGRCTVDAHKLRNNNMHFQEGSTSAHKLCNSMLQLLFLMIGIQSLYKLYFALNYDVSVEVILLHFESSRFLMTDTLFKCQWNVFLYNSNLHEFKMYKLKYFLWCVL